MARRPGWPRRLLARRGRLVPFEADKISQALFAASEGLGRPDPFLARELTDGVLHFFAQEYAGAIQKYQRTLNLLPNSADDLLRQMGRLVGLPQLLDLVTAHERRTRAEA